MAKLLLIGSLTNKKDPTITGGVTVLFELLLNELRDKNIDFDVIDTLKDNYSNPLVAYFYVVFKLISSMHKYSHISLQATANSFITIGPVMIFFAKILNKKTSMRKFAGNFNEIHSKSKGIKKYLIEYVLRNSDVNFFETKYLVEYFKPFNKETYWFPNVRKRVMTPSLPREYKKRFIFIGTVNPEKGIDEICETIHNLNNEYIVDIYGPIYDKKYSNEYFEKQNVSYKGALKPEEVMFVLNEYDVLLLPSYREGYPGIIIEAFSLGIPVIATNLTGIMEMIENGKNGLLVDVKSISQLTTSINSITVESYSTLSEEAMMSFDNFNSKVQTDMFLEKLNLKETYEYR